MNLIKEAIIAEVKDLMPKTVKFQNKMESAKTKHKREHFRKKLIKNNKRVAELIITLHSLNDKEAANGTLDEERGTTETSQPEESTK